MAIIKAGISNVQAPNGGGLAIYVDSQTSEVMLKDNLNLRSVPNGMCMHVYVLTHVGMYAVCQIFFFSNRFQAGEVAFSNTAVVFLQEFVKLAMCLIAMLSPLSDSITTGFFLMAPVARIAT